MHDCGTVTVIGAGLAGSEAAHQAAKFGLRVRLYEMRPNTTTPAHQTPDFAELVCSNSLKSASTENASGILKEEMLLLRSITIAAALRCRVPAGKALAVDRAKFSGRISRELEGNPLIEVVREEVSELPPATQGPVIIATGPLTSPKFTEQIREITGSEHLYFFDSISPIVDGETIDYSKVFRASRYSKGSEPEGDYLNCPLSRQQYQDFVKALLSAEQVSVKEFEKELYFESCLPIEVMASRGVDSLRYGPMRPVGLTDPKTGRRPYAVVQLRTENTGRTMYNIVGFQTKLKYPEQRSLFKAIPGLESAEFLRYGSIHRNTYIHSPGLLRPTLELKKRQNVFFAGQIVGVEGYVESAAMGIVAGRNAALCAMGMSPVVFPPTTAIGSLLSYITDEQIRDFQPMNINFGLFPQPQKRMPKSEKRSYIAKKALERLEEFAHAAFGHINSDGIGTKSQLSAGGETRIP
ncbi:MAG: methylenetetrahydrofolate--tRNA-(uracil(54)-C(5))-methyltransferase (FADH(2)-oxidizing) TrmFO [Candidatus Dadabacteria bacterium]|nr:methylenetetrahydrofolate--tRNA-(uracil(54)-C(5))-methyltransferase (FADH(2)-oxidizing) TrmFO [Candidatus Dadabacteria bacterium]